MHLMDFKLYKNIENMDIIILIFYYNSVQILADSPNLAENRKCILKISDQKCRTSRREAVLLKLVDGRRWVRTQLRQSANVGNFRGFTSNL